MAAPKDLEKDFNIRLADFGQAAYFPKRDGEHSEAQLPTMRAPEVVLGLPWDTKADIWNLACFVSVSVLIFGWYLIHLVKVWETFEARWMFHGQLSNEQEYSAKGHLSEMVYYLGPAPETLVSRQIVRYLDSEGDALYSPTLYLCSNSHLRRKDP